MHVGEAFVYLQSAYDRAYFAIPPFMFLQCRPEEDYCITLAAC